MSRLVCVHIREEREKKRKKCHALLNLQSCGRHEGIIKHDALAVGYVSSTLEYMHKVKSFSPLQHSVSRVRPRRQDRADNNGPLNLSTSDRREGESPSFLRGETERD